MRSRVSVRRASAKIVKNALQSIGPCHYYTNADCTQVEEQPKIVEVTVKEWVLVVPFDFEGDSILEAVNLVCRGVQACAINLKSRLKLLFNPTSFGQKTVNEC